MRIVAPLPVFAASGRLRRDPDRARRAITDTSYSNVAFFDGRKYVTPDTFLLNGTRRQYLLGAGVLTERRITPSDLGGFERVVLINAMLGIEDDLAVPIERIRGL